LRPGAELNSGAKVGNFCEVKNAIVGEGAKINHLSYVGDADVGAGANVGAGTITCNNDGFNKHRTGIGAGAFIGSNSALVAPVSVGDDAYVASGSVITDNVPSNALAFGRARQDNKDGMAEKLRERGLAEKARRQKPGN
jgi:bifunctional UDP-N-acetylglucosamine pyrophosphorylase/glucosamine-1-phosphate N-acetyltransferase